MNIDPKHLNLKMFEGMSREQLLTFAENRNITVSSDKSSIEELRLEVAQKDALRFANKGLRFDKNQNKQEPSLMDILKRLEAIEKHLGIKA